MCSSKTRSISSSLHGITFQKRGLFTFNFLRISSLARILFSIKNEGVNSLPWTCCFHQKAASEVINAIYTVLPDSRIRTCKQFSISYDHAVTENKIEIPCGMDEIHIEALATRAVNFIFSSNNATVFIVFFLSCTIPLNLIIINYFCLLCH
jgi:hypothetical protein